MPQILLLLLLLLLNSPLALADESVAQVQQTSCGQINGEVLSGDGSLCERDIALGFLFEIAPGILNYLTPLWRLEWFGSGAEGVSQNAMLNVMPNGASRFAFTDSIFEILFQLFFNIIIICLVMYGGMLSISVVGRLVKGEALADPFSGKDGPKSWIFGGVIGGGLLVPLKGFFLGQLAIFSIGLLALSGANFLYSIILSSNQVLYSKSFNPVAIVENETATRKVQDRHDFLADIYYRNLIKMELCRTQSGSYLLSGEGHRFRTPGEYANAAACALPKQDIVTPLLGKGVDVAGFIRTSTALPLGFVGESSEFPGATTFHFVNANNNATSCALDGEVLLDYECGSMEMLTPNWASNPLIRLFGNDADELINKHLVSLQTALPASAKKLDVASILDSHWLLFKEELTDKFSEAWVAEHGDFGPDKLTAVSGDVVSRRDALRQAMLDNARPHLQQAAQFFFHSAMNMLMFGQSYMQNGTPLRDDWGNLRNRMATVTKLASIVEQAQCAASRYDLHNSELTAAFLRGELMDLPADASARCLSVSDKKVLEFDENYGTSTKADNHDAIQARVNELSAEYKSEYADAVAKLAEQRREIEAAFSRAISSDDNNSWWINLRQQGYLSVGDYAQSVNTRVNGYKRQLKQVVNNFVVSPGVYDDRYLSTNLSGLYSIDSRYPSFSGRGGELFFATRPAKESMDPLISNAQWIVEQEKIIREAPFAVDGTDMIDAATRVIGLSDVYLTRLGIGLKEGSKDPEKCLTDPKQCPFPLSDPIIELSLLGHDMVDIGIAFFAAAIPVKILSGKSMEQLFVASEKRQSGSTGAAPADPLAKVEQMMGSNGLTGRMFSVLKGLASASAVLDMMFDALSGLMALFLAFGMLLAYLLPLVPKLYIYFSFLSWFSVLVMASFAILLWAVFWIRFLEKREMLKRAGFHYAMELLLRPMLSLIAVVFASNFFYVSAFIVGVTMGWVFALPVSGEGAFGIRAILDTFIVLVLLVMVYVVALRYAYQLMGDLSSELLKRLGVNDDRQQDKLSEFLQVILFDRAKNFVNNKMNVLDREYGRDAAKSHLLQRAKAAQMLAARHNKAFDKEQAESNGQ